MIDKIVAMSGSFGARELARNKRTVLQRELMTMFQALSFQLCDSRGFLQCLLDGKEVLIKVRQSAGGWDYQIKATVDFEEETEESEHEIEEIDDNATNSE